jgi:Domain of unknown function (DUF4440)
MSELLDIEKKLWTNDPDFYHETYLSDAVLIFPGVGRLDRATAVAAIREENKAGRHWAEVHFDEVLTRDLGEGVVLLSYTARARWNHEKVAGMVLCATVDRRESGRWRVALHQQTLVRSGA